MGIFKAGIGAFGGVMADQWRDFFYSESMPVDVLVAKGQKRVGGRSSNTKGENNIISNGSIIAVADGQCMIIVDQGKVVDICAEPGEFVYDTSTEPTLLYGGLNKENIKAVFSQIGKRFTFGGDPGKDQRVYYFNTKELVGNKYGTPSPVPFRVVDERAGIDIDIGIRCFGEYSYKITNPMLFYTNVTGNVERDYNRSEIDGQLKSELMSALQPAFAKISQMGIRYSALPGHTEEIANAINEVLSAKWSELRGLEIISFGVSSVKASDEDEKMIKELQRNAAFMDPTRAAAHLVGSQAAAMQSAASNPTAGPAMAFMGMGMAQNVGGMNAQGLYGMGQQGQQPPTQPQTPQTTPPPVVAGWICASCGHRGNIGKFCAECGKPQPAQEGWACSCGAVNKVNFCQECGKPKPAGAPLYKCDKCGWEPKDLNNPPKFCPECGDVFDEKDQQ
ncbi:MAG: SPFH domain-containing protein [Clostridiales bacterium]|nr:SPFH domain-containing protein [Clostridiales bacterium]